MTKFIYFGVYNMGCWVVMNGPGVLTPRCAPLGCWREWSWGCPCHPAWRV